MTMDWELSWRVHVVPRLHSAKLLLPAMLERGRGTFVIITSAAGLLMFMRSAPYTTTKHASVTLAEWLAVHYGGRGIQIHYVCPQGVRTPMLTADPSVSAEVSSSVTVCEPDVVADHVIGAIRANQFLVLPHPQVHNYKKRKVADRDR